MREIEIKARLKDRESVIKKLEESGCVLSREIKQFDTVYVKSFDGSFKSYDANKQFLRLRVRDDGVVLFTVKQPQKNGLDKIEYEVEVSSKEEMEKALVLMGFKQALITNKKRVTAHYKDYEICLDDVENLGSFIEIEKQGEGNAEEIQEELFKFAESIGVSRNDRVFVGYDVLAFNNK